MAARRPTPPKGPTPVEATSHADKRTNIPTADAQDFVDPDIEQPQKLRYPRDPSLDPQLVWRGKDVQDGDDLVVDAPPIYIQEKVDPRVLIENLRDTAAKGEPEPEATLFDDFDGLDELDIIDFYKHDANWSNRMILGDSLQVMGSLAEREALRGKVQMVYLDPPYGIKFGSNWQVSARKRDVKDGKMEDAAREAEQIKAFRDTWELGIHSYLSYLRDRLIVARDLLTESGSCFVQIGDENVHLVRSLMDEVFGGENFVNQIPFATTSSSTNAGLPRIADYLVWFARDQASMKYRDLYERKGFDGRVPSAYNRLELADGQRRSAKRSEIAGDLPEGARLYSLDNLTSQGAGREKGEGAASWFRVEVAAKSYTPGSKNRWKTNEAGMERLLAAGRVEATQHRLGYVRYLDDFPGMKRGNIWTDTVSSFMADKLYVVQTNQSIVKRCLLMVTDPGDLVVDPTCGSGTTAAVAEQWGRRWITIDTSRVALALARQRLMGAKYPYYLLADSEAGRDKEAELAGRPVAPSQVSNDIRRGFVYERIPHITLRSIASNPDIGEGMTREAIASAIERHTDFETLYDKPYEDKKTVRVTGPFTVESLSPHRSLAFAGTEPEANRKSESEIAAEDDPGASNFEQSILDNLMKAGIQNGRRNERITFSSLDSYAGIYLQAVGQRLAAEGVDPGRVAVSIGPQYGTVSPKAIKDAAREAIKAEDVDLLCILGFAFDPQAIGVAEADGVTVEATDEGFANVEGERKVGRIPVLLVRMNADLLMGEDLKKTGSGNLFTIFGEPDIDIRTTEDGHVVAELLGVDVYDPTTGEIRSNDTSRIALWMIDTDYNEESFFVRDCYFTGGNDPYKRLKTALKADINPDAWASMYATESRPFAKPSTGRIAVKVINDYGDEVMKVFEVG